MKNTKTAKTPETAAAISATETRAAADLAPTATAKTPAKKTATAKTAAAKKTAAKVEPAAAKVELAAAESPLATAAASIAAAAETPLIKSVKEQTEDIIAAYIVETPTPTPAAFWSFMNARRYPIAISGKMLLELGGYTPETRADLYKSVIRFRRALLVYMQARERVETEPTKKNKETLRAAIVDAYKDYDNLRAAIGITETHETHCLDFYADTALRLARADRADITRGYKFNSISETALINVILKFYSVNVDENRAQIAARLEKRAARLAKLATPATETETAAK